MNNLIALVNIAGLILIIENYLSYAWSVVGAFRKDQEQSKADYNLLKFSNITFWVLSLYIIAIRFETILPNLYMVFPFQALATLVFWKTTLFTKKNKLSLAFSKDLPEIFYKTGPYSFLRHPFYFSYLLCYTSVSLLLLNPLIFISLLLVYFVYYKGLRAEENKFSRSIFKNDYEKYKESTGAILPRPKLLLKFLSFLLLTWK